MVEDEGGVRLGVTFGAGHKTGLYLDQRENRHRFGALARGRDVLDAFAYTGVRLSRPRRRRAAGPLYRILARGAGGGPRNLALNGVTDRGEIVATNVFDELRRLDRARARFGLIALDPPPFARGRAALDAAPAATRRSTSARCACSPPAAAWPRSPAPTTSTGRDFAATPPAPPPTDAGVRPADSGAPRPGADHPVLLTVPETRYLKGLLLERSDGAGLPATRLAVAENPDAVGVRA